MFSGLYQLSKGDLIQCFRLVHHIDHILSIKPDEQDSANDPESLKDTHKTKGEKRNCRQEQAKGAGVHAMIQEEKVTTSKNEYF